MSGGNAQLKLGMHCHYKLSEPVIEALFRTLDVSEVK